MMKRHFVLRTALVVLIVAAVAQPFASQTKPARPGQSPPGWSAARTSMMALIFDGKYREAIALSEKWVAKYPDFADAHLLVGSAYESNGRELIGSARGPASSTERLALFETAAQHFRRAFDLGGGDAPDITVRVLIDIYGLIGLDRPVEQEKIVREAVVRYPAIPIAHVELISMLVSKGATTDAIDKAVVAARTSLPKTADARAQVGGTLAFRAMGRERLVVLSDGGKAAMAGVANSFLDDALTMNPDHVGALEDKVALLRAQAEYASDPKRAALLRDEASRLDTRLKSAKEKRLKGGAR